jgi:D-arabinose 1-dehydrogenase-like Zn-dependent alcohol dehydrogenase
MAPLLCAGVAVFNGIKQMNVPAGGVVAVQGLGGLGHLAIQYAHKMGYRTVALSSNDSKKQFATELGASDYLSGSSEENTKALQAMGGADLIVITAPNPKLVSPLLWALAAKGKVLCLARK